MGGQARTHKRRHHRHSFSETNNSSSHSTYPYPGRIVDVFPVCDYLQSGSHTLCVIGNGSRSERMEVRVNKSQGWFDGHKCNN